MGGAATDERGTGTVLALGILVVIMVLFVGAAVVGRYLVASHRARSAADLAALAGAVAYQAGSVEAGVVPGMAAPARAACRAARASVRANHADLVGCDVVGDPTDFVVTVRTAVPVGRAFAGLPSAAPARAHAGPVLEDQERGP